MDVSKLWQEKVLRLKQQKPENGERGKPKKAKSCGRPELNGKKLYSEN